MPDFTTKTNFNFVVLVLNICTLTMNNFVNDTLKNSVNIAH